MVACALAAIAELKFGIRHIGAATYGTFMAKALRLLLILLLTLLIAHGVVEVRGLLALVALKLEKARKLRPEEDDEVEKRHNRQNGIIADACGIPVRRMFRSGVRKEDAKRAFGIPVDHRHLVMMCGSMGCGPIMSIARRIARALPADQDLTIVCGTNKQLFGRLSRRFCGVNNVHIRSYVKDMALLMDSADLYLTKPGGISVTEAASMRLPMVFIDAVSGCEEYNKDFFLRTGGAVTGQTPREIARTSLKLLSNEPALEKMGDALGAAVPQNAAANILSEMSAAEEEGDLA